MNLETLVDEMMMYKRRSVRKNNATNVYITVKEIKTYKIRKKLEQTQRKL
jgi:hypothetical protein